MSRVTNRIVSLAAGLCLALVPGPVAAAQDMPPPPAPGDIPVEAFVTGARLAGAEIAPDGKHFAYEIQRDGKTIISLADFETKQVLLGIEGGVSDDYLWFNWAGPRRILFSRMVNEKEAFRWSRGPRLFVFDLDSRQVSEVALRRQGLDGNNVIYTDPAGQFILLSVSAGLNGAPPSVWRVPLDGTAKDNAVKVQDGDGDISRWIADETGVVRMGMGRSNRGSRIVEYRSGAGQKLSRVEKVDYLSDDEDKWGALLVKAGSDLGLTIVDDESERGELRELNLATGVLGDVIHAEMENGGVTGLIQNRGDLLGLRYTDDAPRIHWLDQGMARHQALLDRTLPGGRVAIQSVDEARDRMLVVHRGAADPGALYLYSPKDRRLDLFFNLRPDLDHRALSEPQRFDFTSRDGHAMHGYLTTPKGREAKDLPLIVYPHGGPFGVRDLRTYDDWVQLLVSRGYAVLQVNFRGSSGQGLAFEELGYGTIGREMQDDLEDAVDWASAQGIVDPDRTCLLGASYGGYAAMWGVIRNPERYRCAVSLNGVTDWDGQLEYDRWFFGKKFYEKFIEPEVGERNTVYDDVSVVKRIKDLQRPLLVAHGSLDRRVPYEQSNMLSRASHRTGAPVEFLKLEDGHGLWLEASQIKFTTEMLAFFLKHNPPGDIPATGG